MSFDKLGVMPQILDALAEKNYSEPTPIQEKTIPLILEKNDVLGSAQTGTGKTAAFAIPILQLLNKQARNRNEFPKVRSLILTPTRELAIQIEENIKLYGKFTHVKHAVIYGGVKQAAQVKKLERGVHILVATPGRLLDLINQGYITLQDIEIFVLDEADRMLDMGFINDIRKVLKMLPEQRQSLFFSATLPDNIIELSKKILTNPTKVEVNPKSSTAETIQQYLYYTNKNTKKHLLLHILKDKSINQVLLFMRTKHGTDKIAKDLKKQGVNAAAIHGDKGQGYRQRVLAEFKNGDLRVMVATEIAARGLDISKLQYVINYDIPEVPEDYVHRIGRTGRAGKDGVAISFSEPEENAQVRSIEKLIKMKIPNVEDHPYPQTDKPMTSRERKEFNKEKEKRKQEYFANLKEARSRKANKPSSKLTNKIDSKQAGTSENSETKLFDRPSGSSGGKPSRKQRKLNNKSSNRPSNKSGSKSSKRSNNKQTHGRHR
jgi:ATP-dependent RNA helicase RhlE